MFAMLWRMLVGELIGTVWGARQSFGLAGTKLVVVRMPNGQEILAADHIGANVGEQVLVANGSRVRDLLYGPQVPVKTVLVGIVDQVAVEP
jgi:ethanolamine utilization protein EutN